MTTDRFTKVGIQRELHIEWFDQAARYYSVGFSKANARQEIYSYLDSAPGFTTPPSLQSKTYIANVLIKSWISPEQVLIPLRDQASQLLRDQPEYRFPIHWCLLSAAYPFWFEVAAVIGRLLRLQDQVTQAQVVLRLKERYGDRQTISRRARYVIRSYVAWGLLGDSAQKGCYEKVTSIGIADQNLVFFMIEAVLNAIPAGKGSVESLLNSPAFFPFVMPTLSGELIAQSCAGIEVDRYGLNDELLSLTE
jgi:hypothetical protein